MKGIILSLPLFLASIGYAQVKFEKGYIISKNDNAKKEVLIKNLDWINSPDNFTYKKDNNSIELKGTPSDIKEFRVYGSPKYISYNGLIDTSPSDLSNLSNQSEPENKNISTFLKEIISGDKNLYSYIGSKSSITYFYSDSNVSEIKPLIYKKYHPDGNESLVATNESYLQQLKDIFNNDPKSLSLISQTRYSTNSLVKVFKVHNSQFSENSDEEAINIKKVPIKFNLHIRPGVNFYSPLKTTYIVGSNEFPSTTNFRIGIEAEMVLPFNKNKWAILLEPTYSFYTNKKITAATGNNLYNMSMDGYSFINIPVGIRHYMYLNEKSKFFLNGQMNLITLRSGKAKTIDLDYEGYIFSQTKLASNQTFRSYSFGAGYNYNNKYSIELRYNTANNIIDSKEPQKAKISYTSIILGYNIF
ncbi:hypothetical protein [Chryseobacterium taiwanense]|uniref:Outer membrane protein beta-barrel domain-containing protein n=1 Tax=Chryseobacterium taiwanense TaxID=363331 RepID=A0A0B4DG59_9FLAO|nr:hypothetical protein [Chryseobacterium taiwanense]KIC63385.1 hypothetical protein RM51_06815 [Chryseobacterium taiwanense]